MHSLVRRFLKTGVLFLAAGLALGAWMMVRREILGAFPSPYQVSAHTHAIAVGFVMSMIMGVALWIFPRPARDDERYSPRLAEWSYWFVMLGTAGRIVGELLRGPNASPALRWGIVVSSFAQIGGIAVFFFTMWSRIRPLGSQQRELKGEKF